MSDRAIFNGAVRIAVFVFVAKVVVALREVVIARQYGVGPITDAFNIAMTLGTWLPVMLAAAIGAALVPALVRNGKAGDEGIHRRFIAELNGHAVAIALIVTAATAGVSLLAPSIFATGNAETDALVARLLILLVPYAGVTVLFYYLSNRLQAVGSFAYAMVEGVPALAVAAAALTIMRWPVVALGVATLVGGILQIGVLLALLHHRRLPLASFSVDRRTDEWRALLAGVGAMTAGQMLLSLILPLDQYFAAQTHGGVPAALGYANRLLGLATSVGTLVLARALLPGLAAIRVADRGRALASTWRWTAAAFVIGALALTVGQFMAEPATRIILQRGSFSVRDTEFVAMLIRYGLWQLPFYFSGVAAVQWLAVEGRFTTIAWIAAATLLVKLMLIYQLTAEYGAAGIMMSTAGMYAFAWVCQVVALWHKRAL